jgi:gluconolactonase
MMNRILAAFLLLTPTMPAAQDGFVPLFNGRDLSGWKIPAGDNGHWRVVDGVIDYDAESEAAGDKSLWSEREFGDFVLRLEWRLKSTPFVNPSVTVVRWDGTDKKDASGRTIRIAMPDSDSGVYLRGSNKSQVNIWSWPIGSGEVYGYRTDEKMPAAVRAGVTPKKNADRDIGAWNAFEITMRGDRLTVVLNGETVIENAQLPGVPARGPIALQHHGEKKDGKWVGPPSLVQFRNITVRELGSPSKVIVERLDPRFDQLVPPDVVVEPIADGLDWVEGPVWRHRNNDLLFSNIPKNAIMRWSRDAGLGVFLQPSGYTGKAPFTGPEPGSNGLTVDSEGRLVLCQHGDRRITRIGANDAREVLAERYEGKRLNSPNDLVFGPDGALYFTDPPYGLPKRWDDPEKELPFQGVYRRAADGTLTLLVRDLRAPNGIGFAPDGRTMYVAQSDPANAIWMAYDVLDGGRVGGGRVFASAQKFVAERRGLPDGLKVDRAGNLFATGPGGVYVFARDGAHLGTLLFNEPTGNCAWGEDGSTLFITANKTVYRARLTTSGPVPGA